MKKNRFVGRCLAFFLVAVLPSVALISCKEDSDDIVKRKTITEVLNDNERFSILKDIVIRAEMSDALRTGELTFFAPDNAAFGRANIFDSNQITSLPVDSAAKFIQNHIIPKETISYDKLKEGKRKSLAGREITLSKTDSVFAINKADIVIRDLSVANGVIHIIDSVAVRY